MVRRVLLAVTLLALVGGLVWLSRGRTSADSVMPGPDAPTRSARVRSGAALEAPVRDGSRRSGAGASDLPAAPGLRVRSSAGIALGFVELRADSGWERVELHEGSCELGARALPLEVRAPGHVARRAESPGQELVLEPDALLVIEGANLRACMTAVQVQEADCQRLADWAAARELAVCSGWISNLEYGIAVATDRREPLPAEMDICLERADGDRRFLGLVAQPGLRARWRLDCEGLRPTSSLEVHVQRLPGERGELLVMLDCAQRREDRLPEAPVAWGSVAKWASALSAERRLAAGEDSVRFPVALDGRPHALAAMDVTTHAFGRLEFVHDGRPRTVELHPGLEFRGRVVDAQTHAPLRSTYLRFEGIEQRAWIIESQHTALDEHGSFTLRGPTSFAAISSGGFEPPRTFDLFVSAQGYDDARLRVERLQPLLLEAGEIALVPHRSPLVLAPGHGVKAAALDGQQAIFADRPSEGWSLLAGTDLPDGRLQLEFVRDPAADPRHPRFACSDLVRGTSEPSAFERDPGALLFVEVPDDTRTFRLAADGLYHRVEEDALELVLRTEALPPAGGSWRIGWSYDGAWVCVGQLASDVAGNENHVRITVPHGAQELWWSSTHLPPNLRGDPGGYAPIATGGQRLVLR